MSIEFPRPSLPPKVADAVFTPAQLAVAEWMSPKSFRVEAGLAWLTERAFGGKPGQNFWWIGESFTAASAALAILKSSLTPGSFTVPNRVPAIVLLNSATIWFRPGDNPNVLFSDSVFAVVVDNAIHVPERSWAALSETMANTHAPARIISTVGNQSNWFNQFARKIEVQVAGQSERSAAERTVAYSRFTALDALEYGLLSQADIDVAGATLPSHLFRALYLAEPYDDRVESAHRIGDPRLMSDAELAIIAGLDPVTIGEVPNEDLLRLTNPSFERSEALM